MKKASSLIFLLLIATALLFSLTSCGECDHEWNAATCTAPKTCTKCGSTEGAPLGHNWKDATCTTPKTCTRCEKTSGNALGHVFGGWVIDREATETETGIMHRVCTACGETETESILKLSHTHTYSKEWSYDDSYHWHDSTCGHDPIGKSGHTFGDWVVDRAPTQTVDGLKHRICTVCDKAEQSEIPSLPHTHTYSDTWSYDDTYHWHASTCGHDPRDKAVHTYGNWIIDREPTETVAGVKHRVCSVCSKMEKAEIPKLSHTHTYSDTWSYDDTYHWHASTCGHDPRDKAVHTYGNWIIDREATESEAGTKHRICTICNQSEQVEIPKLAHRHTYSATWSYDATYHWHDSTCGHDPAGKTAHTYGDWIVDAEPTEDADGAKHRVCSICGKTETVEIAKLSHTHKYSTAWSYDDAYHWHASTCGHDDAVADKAPHDFGDTGICMCGAKDASIAVTVYIDGVVSDTLHTGKAFGYRITPPEKPEDITTNPNSEKYFYAWFVDANFQTPLFDETEFRTNGAIYGKWVTVYSSDFKYTVSEGKATITSLSVVATSTTTLVIPAYINGFPVVAIGDSAFSGNTFIRTLILCNGIQTIGTSAFSGCNSITHLELPKSLTVIGNNAFEGCSTLTELLIPENVTSIGSSAFKDCSGLTSIEIPNGVNTIGYYAFSGCSGLTNIEIPSSVTTIDYYAFSGCTGLTNMEIPSSVTTIGSGAFSGCSGLTSITIPDSVTSIGSCAFEDCTGLTSIEIPDSVTLTGSSAFSGCSGLTSITLPFVGGSRKASSDTDQYPFGYIFGTAKYDGSIATEQYYHYYRNSTLSTTSDTYYLPAPLKSVTITGGKILYGAFYNCKSLTSIEIPNSVTKIDDSAFYGCSGLTSITIPSSVTSIGSSAFSGCTGLTNIEIPNSVTTISDYAFSGCSGLTSVKVPNSVTKIGDSAFRNCTRLTSLTIPNSVTTIGSSAFSGCSGLTSIILPIVGDSRTTSSGTYHYPFGYFFGTSNYSGSIATKQYYYASSTSNTTSATYYLPASLKSVTVTGREIHDGAFYNCAGLTNIKISNRLTEIGDSAFYGCSGLTNIEIPNSVTVIGSSAFSGCSGLTSITIPDSVTSIGEKAFSYCTGFTSIEIPDSVTSIGSSAFSGCSRLLSITLPFVGGSRKTSSDTDQYPFGYIFGTAKYDGSIATYQHYYGNSTSSTTSDTYYLPASLKSVTITGGEILYGAFYNCKSLTSITIPNSVTTIGSQAFEDCSGLTSITIPSSVTSIGSSAFYGCTGLTNIYITDLAAWCNISGLNNLMGYGSSNKNLYLNNKLVTELVIPNGVNTIGSYAFYRCEGLTSITIPDSVTSIGSYVFSSYTRLANIQVASGNRTYHSDGNCLIETATKTLILGCKNSIIPSDGSVTKIGSYAFSVCTGLTSIEISDSVTSISDYAFSGCTGLTSITIGNGVTTIGSYAFSGCSELTSITIPNSVNTIGWYAFANFTGLASITIPDGVTAIGGYAFSGCSELTSITIGNGVTTIDSNAFMDCISLTSVTWNAENCTSAGSSPYPIFKDCTKLATVTIGEKVKNIPSYAFYGCSGLTSVTIQNSVTSIGHHAFSGCSGLTNIYYTGTADEWNAISKDSYWNYNTGNYTIHYNYTPEE